MHINNNSSKYVEGGLKRVYNFLLDLMHVKFGHYFLLLYAFLSIIYRSLYY